MKIMGLMRLGFLGLLSGGLVVGCTAESGGELSILRAPLPTDSCEITVDEEKSLAAGGFDPTLSPTSQDGARIGFIVKNGLNASESTAEVNGSGEPIGAQSPNNVVLSGFNVCYYVADDPDYKALVAEGLAAVREDCEEGSVAVREFSSSGGMLFADAETDPDKGSLAFANVLSARILDELFGREFDLEELSTLGFAANDQAAQQFADCAGADVNNAGEYDPTCSDPTQAWSFGQYVPWVTTQVNPGQGATASSSWGTFPFKCKGSDCTTLPTVASVGAVADYLFDTYGDFSFLLPTRQTTVMLYLQAVGETVTGSSVKSSHFLFPVDLCIGCILEGAYNACPSGLTQTVCDYGSCVVGDLAGGGAITVEECSAPSAGFSGCATDPDATCGPLVSQPVGEVPEIVTCGGGYHLSTLVGYTCQSRTCGAK